MSVAIAISRSFSIAFFKLSLSIGGTAFISVPEPSPPIENRGSPVRTAKVANAELSPLFASSAKIQADNLQNGELQINQADNTTPRKIILLPHDMRNLRAEVKSHFSQKQFTDCLRKFGFEFLDADRKFNDMEKQGEFYAVDIDKNSI